MRNNRMIWSNILLKGWISHKWDQWEIRETPELRGVELQYLRAVKYCNICGSHGYYSVGYLGVCSYYIDNGGLSCDEMVIKGIIE
jgi:hypothetical protein